MSELFRETRKPVTLLMVVFSCVSALLLTPLATVAQIASPEARGSIEEVGTQMAELDGLDVIWQINKVDAVANDDDATEFITEVGFLFAYQLPISVEVDGGDPVDLAVGEALPMSGGEHVTVHSQNETLGSFYTIEIIDLLEIQTEFNKQVIGAPFKPDRGDYTMTLSVATLNPGAAVPVRTVGIPALALVLDGELIHVLEDQTSLTLSPGYAAAGFGEGTVAAGPDGATFLLAELAPAGSGTPEAA